MIIPKYIEKLIRRRETLALQLQKAEFALDEWLDRYGVECEMEDTHGGTEIYVHPCASGKKV